MTALILEWRRPGATVVLTPRGPISGVAPSAIAAVIGPPGPSTIAAEAARDAAVAAQARAEQAAVQAVSDMASYVADVLATPGMTPQSLASVTASGQRLQPNRRYAISPSLGDIAPVLPALSASSRGDVVEIQDVEFGAFVSPVTVHAAGADTIVYQDQGGTGTMAINLSGTCVRFVHVGTYWRAIYYGQ